MTLSNVNERPKDIKVTLTGRDPGAENGLVAALFLAQPAGAKPPPPKPSNPVADGLTLVDLPATALKVVLPIGATLKPPGSLEAFLDPSERKDTLHLKVLDANRFPELYSLEVSRGGPCAATSAALAGLPPGWLAQPEWVSPPGLMGGMTYTNACWSGPGIVLWVKFYPINMLTGTLRDVSPVVPVLRALEAGARGPTVLDLKVLGLTLTIPPDGMAWTVAPVAPDSPPGAVGLERLSPQGPEVSVYFILDSEGKGVPCAEYAKTTSELRGLPAGWSATTQGDKGFVAACFDHDGEGIRVGFFSNPLIVDATPFVPLIKGIEEVIRSFPAASPVTPSVPGYSYSGYEKSIMMASGGLEVPVSWRDSSDKTIPSLRASFPGFEYSWLIAAASGFVHRGNLAAAVDILGVFSDDVTLSPRFGGQHVELGLDFGFSFALGDTTRLGLTAGWHGVVGPITKNSSIALSAIFASYLDDGLALSVRVTPVQLFAANERELMSPLTVDVRVMLGVLALGLEFQYIAPPEPGDQDIPAEAMAFILRFGAGFGRLH